VCAYEGFVVDFASRAFCGSQVSLGGKEPNAGSLGVSRAELTILSSKLVVFERRTTVEIDTKQL